MGKSILDEKIQYHIKASKDDVGKYVILPGDPGRVPLIAQYLEDAKEIANNREFCTYTGYISGEKVTVTSTGIGGPSAAIAIEELIKCGADTFIRVGTSGGMASEVVGGDLVIPTACVRGDGASREYIPLDYPSVANFDVITALKKSAEALSSDKDSNRFHIGVVQSKDSFYGETNPETMPISDYLIKRWDEYLKCGCLASEMECSTLFSVGIARKVRVGAVLTAIWNVERAKLNMSNPIVKDNSRAIKCAVEAIKILMEMDVK